MTIEERLKMLIIGKYGTVVNFSKKIGLPNSTVVGVLNRGVNNSGVNNVIKICQELELSVDALAEGKIIPKKEKTQEGEKDISKIYIALIKRLMTEDGFTFHGEPLTDIERFTLYDDLELDLEKIRRVHERGRRQQ